MIKEDLPTCKILWPQKKSLCRFHCNTPLWGCYENMLYQSSVVLLQVLKKYTQTVNGMDDTCWWYYHNMIEDAYHIMIGIFNTQTPKPYSAVQVTAVRKIPLCYVMPKSWIYCVHQITLDVVTDSR